jgi:hypothetical protein
MVTLFFLTIPSSNITFAGWKTDTIGDATKTYFDITNVTISKTVLQITLAEEPYYNDSGVNNWRFYNIWIDTSMHDTDPDTETWSSDVFEYVAHFDCRWNGSHWLNNSYINAFRYYLTSDGSAKVEGSFYWNGNNWVGSDPDIDVAVISGNNIIFDVDGAIHREQPLGTGYVVQGVANTSNFTISDIAPNNGWVDEFDNMCEPPDGTDTPSPTLPTSFPSTALLFCLIFFGIMVSLIKNHKRKQ